VTSPIAVSILRMPITTPCPVRILPGSNGVTMRDGEPVPIEERTELCAVDAGWMLGSQRVCDVHLREACGLVGIDFDGVVDEVCTPYGEHEAAPFRERVGQPWEARKRYTQDEAREWAALEEDRRS
jgi:hypothetical protein